MPRTCNKTGKQKFRTEFDAQIAIASVHGKSAKRHRQRFSEEPKRAYRCNFCHQWHLTSQEKRDGSSTTN